VAVKASKKSPDTVPVGKAATDVVAPLLVPNDVERTAMPEGAADVPVRSTHAAGAVASSVLVMTSSASASVREMLFVGAALASIDSPRTVPVARFVMSYMPVLYAKLTSELPISARSFAPDALYVNEVVELMRRHVRMCTTLDGVVTPLTDGPVTGSVDPDVDTLPEMGLVVLTPLYAMMAP
jgi:hypothetical protein